MKNIIALFALVLMVSCETIEDRDTLTNSFDADKLEVSYIQDSPGSNNIKLSMTTPGVTGYWLVSTGKIFSNEAEFNHFLPETVECTYVVSTINLDEDGNARRISKVLDVPVTKMTHSAGSYTTLASLDPAGKTWVFDKLDTDDPNYLPWWYVPGSVDVDWHRTYQWLWDEVASGGGAPADADGRMVFDLDGGANYTYFASPEDVVGVKGSFAFHEDFTRIKITGALIPGQIGGANNGMSDDMFWVKEITETTLLLTANGTAWNGLISSWAWAFKSVE